MVTPHISETTLNTAKKFHICSSSVSLAMYMKFYKNRDTFWMVVWIAQSGKVLSFCRRGPGFESRGQPYPDVDSGWRLIHRVRACNWHYTCTSRQWHTQGFGRKKCRVVLPSRGPRLEKRREGCHVSKTWEYKEHLNRGCCFLQALNQPTWVRAWVFSLMINLLARERRQPLWGDWHLL